jgi:hypothetical protein
MWYNLGIGFRTKFLKYGLTPLPIPVGQSMPTGGFGDFYLLYNYISRWIDVIDIVVGSVKKTVDAFPLFGLVGQCQHVE